MGNIINTDDGARRRLWAGCINELVTAKLLEKKRHGTGGGQWYSYQITELGRLWLLNWCGFLVRDSVYLDLAKRKKLPWLKEPIGPDDVSIQAPVEQGDWVIHELDPPTPEFIRLVIGFTNITSHAICMLAYGYPHTELMVDPTDWLLPLDWLGTPAVPFGSAEEMKAYLPEATCFRTFHPKTATF